MMTKFHLASSVSGFLYCACWLTVTMNRTEPLLKLLVTVELWKNYGKSKCLLWNRPVKMTRMRIMVTYVMTMVVLVLLSVCCSPADWSAWGNLETEFWSVASFDFMILRPSVNRISWPFRNFSIWRSTPTTWCLSMHVCEWSMSTVSRVFFFFFKKHWQNISKCDDFPSRKRAEK